MVTDILLHWVDDYSFLFYYYAAESICYHIKFLRQLFEVISSFFNDERKEKETRLRIDHVIRIYIYKYVCEIRLIPNNKKIRTQWNEDVYNNKD